VGLTSHGIFSLVVSLSTLALAHNIRNQCFKSNLITALCISVTMVK